MTQNRQQVFYDQQLPDTDMVHHKRESSLHAFLFASLVFVGLACGGCQSPLPPLPNPPGPHTPVRLSPGDVIKLSFAEETDLDQTQRIRRDGKVSLPLIGEVQAAGKRIIDFQHELTRRYDESLENPEVLVTLENGPATVIVAGFATYPGKITFDRPTTVYQAIMQAGGVSDYGSLSNIHLTRIINGVQHTETINLRPNIRGKPTLPEYVQDGDVIYISRSLF
jgi:protein involved in polysaccharide export with SLBB domain